jgi:hypothetical protein
MPLSAIGEMLPRGLAVIARERSPRPPGTKSNPPRYCLRKRAMARYIPQHLFDGLVVQYLICDIANTPDVFDKLASEYIKKYPDERACDLLADVTTAASEGRYVIRTLMDAPNSMYRTPVDALEGLRDALTKAISLEKPIWRRMVENYFLNVQPGPIPDRVAKAKDHLIAAERVLMQRMAPAE